MLALLQNCSVIIRVLNPASLTRLFYVNADLPRQYGGVSPEITRF
jgi:hypothetical protein